MSDQSGESSLREQLLTLIESWQLDLPSDLDERTPLIASGLFDSLALLNLALWIEAKTGHPIDPASVDIAQEWNSVADIVRYLERARGTPRRVDAQPAHPVARPAPQTPYRIVRYSPSDRGAVAELQTRLWSRHPELNLRYLDWKYHRNPYTDVPRIYLAFHHDELVGMRGFYASRWETGAPAHQWPVLVADDLSIREDHRNRGLVTRIMRAAHEDLRGSPGYLFNLSGGRVTVLGSLAGGWRSIGTLNPMGLRSLEQTWSRRIQRRLRRVPGLWRYADVLSSRGATGRSPFERLDRAKSPLARGADPPVAIEAQPKSKAMVALVNRIGYDGRLRHVRDEAYFDWRFRNPLREYRFLYAGGDVLDGYLVLKRSIDHPGSPPRVSIVDLEAINGRVQGSLLRVAVRAGGFAELVIWTATTNDEQLRALHTLGFAPIDQELAASGLPCFLVRPIEDERLDGDWRLGDTRLLDLENWDVRMLFSMAG